MKKSAVLVVLLVSALLGSAFRMDDPPQEPGGKMYANGKKVMPNTVIAKGTRLTYKIVPDPDFLALMPRDARYGVREITFYVQKGLDPARKIGSANVEGKDAIAGIDFAIPAEVFQASGAKVYMEVSDIYRLNFKGEKIDDDRFGLYEKTYTFITQ